MLRYIKTNYSRGFVRLEIADLVHYYDLLIKYLQKSGLLIHEQSRLSKFGRAITRYHLRNISHNPLSQREIEIITLSVSEFFQFFLIVHKQATFPQNSLYSSKLSALLKDAANPYTSSKQETPGRDAQFELFCVASWFGVTKTCKLKDPPHPDIYFELNGYKFGIEAKRIKSLKSLPKHLKKAKLQLKYSGNGGFIAVDFTSILVSQNYGFVANSYNAARHDLETRLRSLMTSNHEKAKQKGGSNKSIGWLGFAQAIYGLDNGKLATVYAWIHMNFCSATDTRRLVFSAEFPRIVLETDNAFQLAINSFEFLTSN